MDTSDMFEVEGKDYAHRDYEKEREYSFLSIALTALFLMSLTLIVFLMWMGNEIISSYL